MNASPVAELVEHRLAHARHDPHVDDDVGRVGDLDADLAERRVERPHGERDHVHRAPRHAAVEERAQRLAHLLRLRPVVGGTGVVLASRADERAVLDAGHVARVRAGEEGARALLGIERREGAARDHLLTEGAVLLLRTVTPVDVRGPAEPAHLVHPGSKLLGSRRRSGHGVSLSLLVGHAAFARAKSPRWLRHARSSQRDPTPCPRSLARAPGLTKEARGAHRGRPLTSALTSHPTGGPPSTHARDRGTPAAGCDSLHRVSSAGRSTATPRTNRHATGSKPSMLCALAEKSIGRCPAMSLGHHDLAELHR